MIAFLKSDSSVGMKSIWVLLFIGFSPQYKIVKQKIRSSANGTNVLSVVPPELGWFKQNSL
jgi:hypothetical protein